MGMGMGLLCTAVIGLPGLGLLFSKMVGLGSFVLLGIPCAHWIWVISKRSQLISPEDAPYRSGLIIGALLYTGFVLLAPPLLCAGYVVTHVSGNMH